jgi:hypothetical protein
MSPKGSPTAFLSAVFIAGTQLEQLQASPKSKLVLLEMGRDTCFQDNSGVLRVTSTRERDARDRGMQTADSTTAVVGLVGKSRGSLAADHFRRRAAIATNIRANACR